MLNLINFQYREWVRATLHYNRTFAIPISSKYPLKQMEPEKNDICTIFGAKSQTISAVIL